MPAAHQHIAVLGPPDRIQVWEERAHRLIKPKSLAITQQPEAVPKECTLCLFIPETNAERTLLRDLIKRGIHTLVIDHPLNYADSVERLWQMSEEAGIQLWFSLWNLFQPGMAAIYERMNRPDTILINRSISLNYDEPKLRIRQVVAEELILTQFWFGMKARKIKKRSSGNSVLYHLEMPDSKLASIRIAWDGSIDESYRVFSGDMEGTFYRKTHEGITTISRGENQKLTIPLDPATSAADTLLINFFRAVNGLSHRPAFRVFDLYRFGYFEESAEV